MPVNLSIKNVPDDLVERLRRRATASHRSMQGELMAILEEALTRRGPLTPQDVLRRIRQMGLETPDEAVEDIRHLRDSR